MTVTNNAKGIISIIATTHLKIVQERLEPGFIKQGQVMGCLLEQLKLKARHDPDLKIFLETLAHIPQDEDEGKDYPWAKDQRRSNQHIVSSRTGESRGTGPGSVPIEDDKYWPEPGERVC